MVIMRLEVRLSLGQTIWLGGIFKEILCQKKSSEHGDEVTRAKCSRHNLKVLSSTLLFPRAHDVSYWNSSERPILLGAWASYLPSAPTPEWGETPAARPRASQAVELEFLFDMNQGASELKRDFKYWWDMQRVGMQRDGRR
jgi:hypothetical protein